MSEPQTTAYIDGAARGNPGAAAIAVVLQRPNQPVVEIAEAIGTATNNVAEYCALLAALEKAVEVGVKNLLIYSDSELLVKQMNGEYRVKNAELQELYQEAQRLKQSLTTLQLQHVRREQNKRADELCNIALDGKAKAAAVSAPKAQMKAPTRAVGDATVREDCVLILSEAAKAWAANGPSSPPAAMIWEQLWSVIEEAGLLKKRST